MLFGVFNLIPLPVPEKMSASVGLQSNRKKAPVFSSEARIPKIHHE